MKCTKRERFKSFSELVSGHLAGERRMGATDRAEFLVGLRFGQLRHLVDTEQVHNGRRCRVGYLLSEKTRHTGRISVNDLMAAASFLRAKQFTGGGTRGKPIGPAAFSASAVRLLGRYKGEPEHSARLEIVNDGMERSSAAFKANMRQLAQDLGCALAQKAVITAIGRTEPETYEHSPTGMPDPGPEMRRR